MPDLIPQEDISSDFENDDNDSLPDRRPRPQPHLEFSGGDTVDDNAADNDAIHDDDHHHETGAQTAAGAVARLPARPLPLVDDPDLPSHAYSFQDYAYSSSNGSTSNSSAIPLSTIQVNDVSAFQIGEI